MSINRKQIKFGVSLCVIALAAIWLGVSGFQEGKSYYLTVEEMFALGPKVFDERIRLAGTVQHGSIEYLSGSVKFTVEQKGTFVPIIYTGTSPLPNKFKDEVDVVVEGSYNQDGNFYASGVQAKCASKYQADYSE